MAEWKLVPVEPTREMIDAGHMHTMRADEEEPYRARGEAIACYSDMLSAAPQALSGQQAEPTDAASVLAELIDACDAQDAWRLSHPALRQHLSADEAEQIGSRVDKAWSAARALAGQQSERPAPAGPAAREQEASATGAEPMRKHVEDFAAGCGWKREDGEGAFEFVQRTSYRQGWQDGRRESMGDVHRDTPEVATPTTSTTGKDLTDGAVFHLASRIANLINRHDGKAETLMPELRSLVQVLATTRKEPCIPKFGARDTQCSMGTPGCVVIHEATPTDADEAFEELYKVSSRDPSNREDLGFWRDGWAAGQRALGEKNV